MQKAIRVISSIITNVSGGPYLHRITKLLLI
jgi:hypothetical protein